MSVVFACKQCQKKYKGSETMAGKLFMCRECGHEFRIPAPRAAAVVATSSRSLRPAAKTLDEMPSERPTAFRRKKKRRESISPDLTLWVVGAIVGMGVLLAGVGFISKPLTAIMLMIPVFILALVLALWGGIWGLVVAFRESIVCGLMVIFVPFYALYHLITRWQDMCRPFLVQMGALVLYVLATVLIVINAPALRQAKEEANQERLQRVAEARPNHPAPNPAAEPAKPLDDAELTRVLGNLRSGDQARARAAAERLANENPTLRHRETAKALEPLLNHTDVFTRRAAMKAMLVWAEKDNVPALIKVLDGSDVFSRHDAIKLLAKLEDERAIRPLAERLTELGDRDKASEALKAMAAAQPAYGPKIAKESEHLLDNSHIFTRRAALDLTSKWATKDNVPALVKALNDSDYFFREQVMDVLAKLEDERAIEPLAARLAERQDQKKASELLKALAKAQPEQRPKITKALEPLLENSVACQVALDTLAPWASKENVPAIIGVLSDSNSFARRQAIDLLGKLKDDRAAEPLAECLANLGERQKAGEALKAIGSSAEKAVLGCLKSEDVFVRAEACAILKTIGTEKSRPALQAAARERNLVVARAAREALQGIAKNK